MNRPVVFLDKDGTLIENLPYNVEPARVVLARGAIDGLKLLHEKGFRLAIVSNQSGIARGFFPEAALMAIELRLRQLLSERGIPLDGFFYCPHHPEGIVARYAIACDCRKPAPGLLLSGAKQFGVAPADCWMVGDILDDVEAGRRAGCRTILIDNGNETVWQGGPLREPHFKVRDLLQAARTIVDNKEPRTK